MRHPLRSCLTHVKDFLFGTFFEQDWRLLSDTDFSLTLSNTKQGMDLGTLVIPLMQTFHLLHE